MSIFKVNKNLPRQDQIDEINSMVIEVNGLVQSGKFDINELDFLYDQIARSRKFLRNQAVGNTLATYTGWTHLLAEVGYSIWKFSPTSYTYNAVNQLYFDGKLFEDRGLALSEAATTYDNVFNFDGDISGGSFADDTTEAGTEGGTEFSLVTSTLDYVYVGLGSTFAGIKFEFETRGSGHILVVEYWNGSVWTTMTANVDKLVDDTSNFESDGSITYTIPGDWVTNTVNSVSKFWIRVSTSTAPVTVAKAFFIIPANNVPGLLALSSTQALQEDWAWCSFGTAIYVTIRNSGTSQFEGNFFITSASSAANKENFFIYNHKYTLDHEDSTHDPVVTKTASYTASALDGIIIADGTSAVVTVTLPTAVGIEGKEYTVKAINVDNAVGVDAASGETIDASGSYALSAVNKFVSVVSDNVNWLIIGSN